MLLAGNWRDHSLMRSLPSNFMLENGLSVTDEALEWGYIMLLRGIRSWRTNGSGVTQMSFPFACEGRGKWERMDQTYGMLDLEAAWRWRMCRQYGM